MLKAIAEQEHYLLISDSRCSTVVERRAGNFYPLRTGVRHGLDLDDGSVAEMRQSGSYSERNAQCLLVEVASQWRDLFDTSDEADDVPSGTGPPVAFHPM
jgi:hypothetical protein